MGSYDQAGIQHASALHWAQTIGAQRWVEPGRFWVFEPTYAAQAPGPGIPDRKITSEGIYHADVVGGLKRAETYFIDHEIARWLIKSSVDRPPMKLERHLLPSDAGYLWFDQPVSTAFIDGDGDNPLALAAIEWSVDPAHTIQESTSPLLWNEGDTLRLVPWVHLDMGTTISRINTIRYGGAPIASISWKLGMEDLVATDTRQDDREAFVLNHPKSGIRIDAMLDIRLVPDTHLKQHGDHWRSDRAHGAMLDVLARCVEAFGTILLFMNQRLIVSAKERPSRTAQKQMERSDLTVRDIVTVKLRKRVYLQKEHDTEGEHREIDWQWRWPVAGHWRKPRKDGIGPRQPIYIPSYVKGPDNKPLKPANEKLYAVIR